MENMELIWKMSGTLERMEKQYESLNKKFEELKDDRIRVTDSEVAVLKEKVSRLEKIVYGSMAFIIVELISILILWLKGTK